MKVRDPTYMRGSKTERANEAHVTFCARALTTFCGFGGEEGHCRIVRAYVQSLELCPIDRPKKVISDNLFLSERPLIQILLR